MAKVTVTFASAPPSGSAVICNISLIGSDTHAPSESKYVNAPVSGATAVCNLTVPYLWTVASAASSMTIAYSVSGPFQTSSSIYEVIPLPANGATTNVTASVGQ